MTSESEGGVEGVVPQDRGSEVHLENGVTGQEVGLAAGSEVVLPGLGTLLDLSDVDACTVALDELRDLESIMASAKRMLQRVIAADAELKGSLTFELADGRKVTVTTRPTVEYDAEEIAVDLREAGCPEETIAKIIKEEVTHKVVAKEAKKAASANSTYAEIIERHRTEVPKEPSVSITRR